MTTATVNGLRSTSISIMLIALSPAAGSEPRAIDTAKSAIIVRVYKAGLLSAFGHNHEIVAPVSGGSVDLKAGSVELRTQSGALRVRDLDISEKDREEIQKTMLGSQVLDVERFPAITFRSTAVSSAAAHSWAVRGDLLLHGLTRSVTIEVREEGGRYIGSARLKQTEFGITPVRVAGGAVRVKDELRIEFDIRLAE